MDIANFIKRYRVEPGATVDLGRDFDTGDTGGYEKPDNAGELLEQGVVLLSEHQERLYAENAQALLIVLQAMDAAGKDSCIKHVMGGINPQGCEVTSFKAPSPQELDHTYLWRCMKVTPGRGMIGIFNRSYYEEVLVVRVHPSFLKAQRLPPHTVGDGLWQQRFAEINAFEKHLVDNGIQVLKIFLHVGKEEQCARQLERIDKPEKNWKFNAGDLEEREYWNDYMAAYEDMLNHTSTPWAPWYVIPADKKWFTRLVAAAVIAEKLIEMDPQYPTVSEEGKQAMAAGRATLIAECGAEHQEEVAENTGQSPAAVAADSPVGDAGQAREVEAAGKKGKPKVGGKKGKKK
jgi:PPK2 family polyphosphate:nucleotide phosphotransferase